MIERSGGATARVDLAHEPDFTLGRITVRPALREIGGDGSRDTLEPRVMRLLVALARANGDIVSRDDLIESCWDGVVVGEDAINRCVSQLRKIARTSGNAFLIETVPRVGYRLRIAETIEPVAQETAAAPQPNAATLPAAPETAATHPRGAWPFGVKAVVASLVLALAVAGFGLWFLRPNPSGGSAAAPPPASVAVLPFANVSGNPAKDYISDGISEELMNQLANVPALRVAARTSSFAFKGRNEDIRSIAHALNVAAVLEGSVLEDGQQIRITAELINAADGYHLWSKTYDRDLSHILQMQDEIARAIAASLTHGFLGNAERSPAPDRPPIDPEAYRQYLQGQSYSALKTLEGDARAAGLFESVTEAEPRFAPAYAALGRTYVHMAEFQNRRADLVAGAEAALDRALSLDPNNLEALSSQLLVALMQWKWQDAAADARKLEALNPHSVFTLRGLTLYYDSLGFLEQEAATLREATRLDPLSFVDLNNLASVYNNRGEYAEAESAASDALALVPDRALTLYTLCSAYAGMKWTNRARILIGQLLARGALDASQACALESAAASGRSAEAHTLADGIARRFPAFVFAETDIGSFYLSAGDVPKALTWFDRAYAKRDYHLFAVSYYAATPAALSKTPGWLALKQKPEAKAWQAAHDRLATELTAN